MVHGILAARLDAVPEAIECADSPPQLLAAFSGPPGTMNRGGMQANDAEALMDPHHAPRNGSGYIFSLRVGTMLQGELPLTETYPGYPKSKKPGKGAFGMRKMSD